MDLTLYENLVFGSVEAESKGEAEGTLGRAGASAVMTDVQQKARSPARSGSVVRTVPY